MIHQTTETIANTISSKTTRYCRRVNYYSQR